MLDYSTIRTIARDAGASAREQGLIPLSTSNPDFIENLHSRTFQVPFLGDYVPAGWSPSPDIDDLFVDSSGWGSRIEPALTQDQFINTLKEFASRGTYGFGISEAGQFQVFVRVYIPIR